MTDLEELEKLRDEVQRKRFHGIRVQIGTNVNIYNKLYGTNLKAEEISIKVITKIELSMQKVLQEREQKKRDELENSRKDELENSKKDSYSSQNSYSFLRQIQ